MKSIPRIFIPGSEWVYIKIYAGEKTVDKIIAKKMRFIINHLERKHLISKWFFIRYADPDFHLRIRFLLKDKNNINIILSLINSKLYYLIECNLIWKIQLDTYNRELERYGNKLIIESEAFFHIDSVSILSIIKKLDICKNENFRWMIALKLIDDVLVDFSFDLESKHGLISKLSDSYKLEFGFNQYNSKQLNVKFRENKNIIESVLNKTIVDVEFTDFFKIAKKRSKDIKPVQQLIMNNMHMNNLSADNLLKSFIHMTMNRLFPSKNRLHELVLYDFLRRFYASEIAKNKYSTFNN